MFGLPEMYLYFTTFRYIKRHNHKTAVSGIVSQDTIRRRKQQSKLNIVVTFSAWLAQFITNITYFLLMRVFFGKQRFHHILLAVCTVCLNFNVMPFFFIIMVDNDLKVALLEKEFVAVLKFLIGLSNS